METTQLERNILQFESLRSKESRAQSTDGAKARSKPRVYGNGKVFLRAQLKWR